MSSEEVRDFEKKLLQTFVLGQIALVKVVLDAYTPLVHEAAFLEGFFLACGNYKLSHEFQMYLTSYLKLT